jgi:Protein of unknown function (DUF2971)
MAVETRKEAWEQSKAMATTDTNSLTASQFEALVKRLESLDYRSRRLFLWHRVRPRLSRFLYKFRSLDRSNEMSVDRMRDLVVRSRFWLSSPVDFNDPFDMSAKMVVGGTISERKQRIDQLLKLQGVKWSERQKQLPRILSEPDTVLAQRIQATYQQTIEQTGVYSFGGDPRSILMWSHYASNHDGFCLQFEIAKDPETFFKRCVTMKYSEDYPVVNWTTEREAGMQAILERKHIGWKYERERRVVVPEKSRQYISFRPEALRAIIIGCRAKDATISVLLDLIAERSSFSFPTPKLYRAVKHESKYKLLITAFRA